MFKGISIWIWGVGFDRRKKCDFIIVTNRTFGSAELQGFGLAQMTETFSAEQRTFKIIMYVS